MDDAAGGGGTIIVFSNLFTRLVVFARVLVRQVFVHVLIGHAQCVVQHGELLHGIRAFQYRFHFGLDECLGRNVNLRKATRHVLTNTVRRFRPQIVRTF